MTPESTDVIVRRLLSKDDCSQFYSGDIDLDRFFQRYAGQNQFKHYIGTTYIAELAPDIVGFLTVSSGEVTADTLSSVVRKRLPDYPIPILRIARLAVAQDLQSRGVGRQATTDSNVFVYSDNPCSRVGNHTLTIYPFMIQFRPISGV